MNESVTEWPFLQKPYASPVEANLWTKDLGGTTVICKGICDST